MASNASDRNALSVIPTMTDDLARVEDFLVHATTSDDPYLTEIASHLLPAGGKRIRPGFCIAAAATGLQAAASATDAVIAAASSVELVHLGSLYHDDVMDDAAVRRTVESVNAKWGNLQAILAGDFLLARASEIAASLGTDVAALLASTIGRLCEGQLLELRFTFDTTRSEDEYLRSIDGKTAALLAAACRIGGIVGGLKDDQLDALTEFGRAYGTAFQIVDDVLDLTATSDELGKPAGHDIAEGVYTLPLIRALASERGDDFRPHLTDGIAADARQELIASLRSGPWIASSIATARGFADTAQATLATLPASPGRTGLDEAARHLVESVESMAGAAGVGS